VQENSKENNPAQPLGNQKSRRDSDAVEKGVDDQSDQHRISLARVEEFILVRLFPKMKVGGDGMLKKMDDEVSNQDEKGCILAAQFQTRRDHLDDRGGQHKPSAQRDKVSEVTAFPMPLNDDRAAKYIRSGGSKAQRKTEGDWVHWAESSIPDSPSWHRRRTERTA